MIYNVLMLMAMQCQMFSLQLQTSREMKLFFYPPLILALEGHRTRSDILIF